MYCSKCGSSNNEGDAFCKNCGAPLNNSQINNNQVVDNQTIMSNNQNATYGNNNNDNNNNDDKTANNLCYLAIFLYFATDIVRYLNIPDSIRLVISYSRLISYGLIVYLRIKYPSNKLSKTLAIILIVLTIIEVIFFVITMITCGSILENHSDCG